MTALAGAVKSLDPDEQYVRLDVAQKTVAYSDDIVQHEHISSYVGDEEPVRAYLIAWLCTEGGYAPAALELERRYSFGRGSRAELDVRIRREDTPEEAFALIELKAPHDWKAAEDSRIRGQLFAMAGTEVAPDVLTLATVDVGADGGVFMRAVTIAYTAELTYDRWVADGRQHVDEVPVSYNQPLPEPLINSGDLGLREEVTLAELDRIRRQLHNRLWGGARDDNQIYHWLVKLFLTKIHDEKTTDEGTAYTFQVLHKGSKPESAAETAARVDALYAEAYRRYIAPDVDTLDSLDAGPFSPSEIQWVVKMLQGISITSAGQSSGDLLGAFFESITRDGFKQSKGLFFTHYNVAVFMLEVLQVADLAVHKLTKAAHPNDRLPYILDPSCGSGTFLLAAMRRITGHVQSVRTTLARNSETKEQLSLRFPPEAPNAWAKDFIYGIEKREDLAMSTKVNMVLHRDGHTRVYHDDGLAPLDRIAARHSAERLRGHEDPDGLYDKKVAEAFDVIITNPPFSIELDAGIQTSLAQHFAMASERNSENLFLERWYQLLKPSGRLAAVLPESFFSTAENQNARIFLMLHFDIRAIVTLPAHTFQPWTPTRTSLLFAQKKEAADEKRWVTTWDRELAAIEASLATARSALRRLQKPPKRMTDEEKSGLVQSLDSFLGSVGVTRSHTMRAVLDELGETSYVGIMVDEIGYRRTKRAENDRRNDLFVAEVMDEHGHRRVVRNLNSAPEGWRIVSAADAVDALSQLRATVEWR